jgi:hypothetical protein|nr:MAG TPA: hypothetical protein [Caudoviricetes sp.]DAY96148.1 MAG TPA: hypothetical protein [Caudoviricetes sp.]
MENKYVFILDQKGMRITSLLIGVHAETEEECLELAKKEYPESSYLVGGQDMQDQFINGKVYTNGAFTEPEMEVVEPTKKDKIEVLKKEAEAERDRIKDAFAVRQLKGLPTDDLVKAFKAVDIDLVKKIRELK